MAEPWEWVEADLQALVDQRADEGPELDFKRCDAIQNTPGKKTELSKDVSAFANSAGGTLVYGIIEDPETHTASDLDAGYDPTIISKEWIEQVINSNIQPRLSGVRINAVPLTNHAPGKVAYVVSVPQGSTAHQAADKRYYKRFNFESVPMEDYEIRDVMQRVSAPVVSIEFEIDGSLEGSCEFTTSSDLGQALISPRIQVFAVNAGDAGVCEYSQHHLFVPADIRCLAEVPLPDRVVGGTRTTKPQPSRTIIVGSVGSIEFSYLEINWAPNDMPLFPGDRRKLCDSVITIPLNSRSSHICLFLWRTRPSKGRTRTGAVVLQPQEGTRWVFQPMTIERLEEINNWSIDFAP